MKRLKRTLSKSFLNLGDNRLILIWIIISGVVAIIGCLLPMFRTLGYEYALLIALVSSLGSGHLAACYPHQVRLQRAPFPGARNPVLMMYGRVWATGSLLLIVPLALALFNGVRVPPCNVIYGILFYFLLAVLGATLAMGVGLFIGLLTPGGKSASALWFGVFLVSLVAAISTFHSTPAVYSFGPFYGYFPGVLYDELIAIEPRLITYRLITLLQLFTILALCRLLLDLSRLRFTLAHLTSRWRFGAVVLLLIIAGAALHLAGPKLGHRTDREDLQRLLSHHIATEKLDLYFPPETDARTAQNLALDAEFGLHQIETFLEMTVNRRITVFFFTNWQQKGAAIGASRTNVAKPWRGEVYVTVAEVPHRVLRHELAHAVAAELASGPFGVPGAWDGWWPNPGLIEGLAVAAQGPRGDLTIHQWAAAMKQLEMLPPIDRMFGLGFFNLTASAAYTAAGSFCHWIARQHGARALKSLYGGNSWQQATGHTLHQLAARWMIYLDQVTLRPADLSAARHRFDRPSVIHSVCVHEVARLREKAARCSRNRDWEQALAILEQAHRRSGESTRTKLALFFAQIDAGRQELAVDQAHRLLNSPEINSATKSLIREHLIDIGDPPSTNKPLDARRAYGELARGARSEADRRRLYVKAHLAGLAHPSVGRVLDVLAVRPGPQQLSDPLAALVIARATRFVPDDPILAYLLARQYFRYGEHQEAISLFNRATSLGLDQQPIALWFAAKMMRARAQFELNQFTRAKAGFQALAKLIGDEPGRRARVDDWISRCTFRIER